MYPQGYRGFESLLLRHAKLARPNGLKTPQLISCFEKVGDISDNKDDTANPLQLHEQLAGKIRVRSTIEHIDADALRAYYTPGVGAVSRHLAEHPEQIGRYTSKSNLVAVVSDGSAVLGLGNVGPEAALPVMEGKAMLFERLAGVSAMPLVLDTQDTDEIIATVKAVAPAFGGINLEDISAPRAYEIERRLQDDLNIPVMHDDQHATAIVVLAGLINACRVTDRELSTSKVVVVGAGAAGSAITKLLVHAGAGSVTVLDSRGIITPDRSDLDPYKRELAELTDPDQKDGGFSRALEGADIVVGVSGPEAITADHIRNMAGDPIVFALSNPDPEIIPEDARSAGAAVTATGRSDFANQINNVLVFPGLFCGLLDSGARTVTNTMKTRAAEALAGLVPDPNPEYVISDALDKRAPEAVAEAVSAAGV